MKKILIALGVTLILGAIPVIALSQTVSPDPQNSHILIQNVSSQDASVVVQVYNADTGVLETEDSFTIPGNGAVTVHATSGTNVPGHRYLGLPSGFKGSMVVASDNQVVAINVNAGGSPFTSHSAYEAVSSDYASTQVFVPSIHWRRKQWTLVGIQNTGSVAATGVYTYLLQDGTIVSTGTLSLEPGRSEIRNIASDIDVGTWPEGVGAMQISADQPVGVAVWETLQENAEAYLGFPSYYGDTKIYLPSIHHHPQYLQTSHILVQNMSLSSSAAITLTYYNQDGTVANQFNSTIDPAGSLTYHTNNQASADGKYYEPTNMGLVGSAVIESDQPVVAVVVEVLGPVTNGRPYAYRGFRHDAGGTDLLFPSVHNNDAGQFSHILVQNLDSVNSNQIRLEYIRQDGTIDTVYTTTLPAAGALTFHTNGVPSTDGKVYDASSSFGNVGSARVVSLDGRPLVGVNVETLRGILLPAVYAGFTQ